MMHAHMKMALSTVVLLFAVYFCQTFAQTTTAATTTTTMTTTMSTQSSTANSSTSTMSTMPPTTTMMSTTTTEKPIADLMHNMKDARYELKFTVGPTNMSDIQYVNTQTAEQLKMKFTNAFKDLTYEMLELMSMADDNDTYTLTVTFLADTIGNTTIFATNVQKAFMNIENDNTFQIPNANVTEEIVAQFLNATQDICAAMDVCPIGFLCNELGCAHMCHMEDCSGHGTCILKLLTNNTAQTMCNCDEEYDTEYEGDHCEMSSRGRDQIIAILAAVLGTACFILLVILIIMCVLQARKNSKYDMASPTTHTNQAFVGKQ